METSKDVVRKSSAFPVWQGYKVAAISDVHGFSNKDIDDWFDKNSGEILLFAGDLQYARDDTGTSFLNWFSSLPFIHKVMTFGNHDFNYKEITVEAEKYGNIHVLNNKSVILSGLKIFGSPYSLPFGPWEFMVPEEELAVMYSKIEPDTDIILTHGPPYGILDESVYNRKKVNAGSRSLLKAIDGLPELKASVFGHIHEGYGVWWNDRGTQFVNASLLNERYEPKNLPLWVI